MTANEFSFSVRVYYEDTDAGGVVYHSNYLRFMERARTEWLRALGCEQDVLMREQGLVFAVRQVNIDYLKPARLNELLDVNVELLQQKRASARFRQSIHNSAGDLLCEASVVIVCVNATELKPCAIPAGLFSTSTHPETTSC
ncbi:MAG: tol-pal system-associated acyl-CoA thioesterase [Gammaproteobacteria bacterium]